MIPSPLVYIGRETHDELAEHQSEFARRSLAYTGYDMHGFHWVPEDLVDRPEEATSTHARSRFMVPWLCNYTGWALFTDHDVCYMSSPTRICDHIHAGSPDVMVVVHERYDLGRKLDGSPDEWYPWKNSSSVMLINCGSESAMRLGKRVVRDAPLSWLHSFEWADSVGMLDARWNVLAGIQEDVDDPHLVHWTTGTPRHACSRPSRWDRLLPRSLRESDPTWRGS